ncbi:MAG: MOB kinase activator 1B [Pycnora praestabilis]|nr:MAG: MOB kinase activator 1B [Pycnora praestabilis]
MLVAAPLSPQACRPLSPISSLVQSSSCVTLCNNAILQLPSPPEPTYTSPLTRDAACSLSDDYISNARTRGQFKPRNTTKGTSTYQLRQFAEATLGSGSLRKAVKLPEGEDLNEWLAVNVVDFYNQINLLYGSITEFCSPQSCPEMKATDEYEPWALYVPGDLAKGGI